MGHLSYVCVWGRERERGTVRGSLLWFSFLQHPISVAMERQFLSPIGGEINTIFNWLQGLPPARERRRTAPHTQPHTHAHMRTHTHTKNLYTKACFNMCTYTDYPIHRPSSSCKPVFGHSEQISCSVCLRARQRPRGNKNLLHVFFAILGACCSGTKECLTPLLPFLPPWLSFSLSPVSPSLPHRPLCIISLCSLSLALWTCLSLWLSVPPAIIPWHQGHNANISARAVNITKTETNYSKCKNTPPLFWFTKINLFCIFLGCRSYSGDNSFKADRGLI